MTVAGAIGVVLVLVLLVAFFYMMFFGLDRWIAKRVRSAVAPGETIVFESRGSETSTGLRFLVGVRQGHLVVTEQNLLMGSWVLPPFWKTIRVIPIRDIDKVTTLNMFGISHVHLATRGRKYIVSPHKNRLWPFAGDTGKELVAALQGGTDAHFATHVSSGFQDYIRSQIEPKQ